MTKTLPSFLRVHHATSSRHQQDTPSIARKNSIARKSSVDDYWHAYQEVTGWRLDPASENYQPPTHVPLTENGPGNSPNPLGAPKVSKLSAQRLADAAYQLTGQLADAHETIRIQSAELAARAAIVMDAARENLADTLAKNLHDAVLACRCDAAAIYLLDDDTQHLALRSMHGLPTARMAQAPRELQGSRGDLEAMVRGVVLIGDLNELSVDTWNCPENASGAICAAILSGDVPIGTLWLYFNETQLLEDSHAAIARMAAGNVGLQLQHAAAKADTAASSSSAPSGSIDELSQWQFAGLPLGTQLAPHWRVDGMIESPQPWATGWHAWDVLPDGSLMIAIAEATDKSVAGSMISAISRAALESHTGYRHTPQQLLQRISDTLWQTNSMDQLTSMMYVRIDPETGEGEIASAGNMIAMIASRYGYRPAVEQNDSPLASQIDLNCAASTFRLTSGEVLMAYGEGFAADGIDQTAIGNRLRESMQIEDVCPLASIRRFLADKPMHHERGAITILHQ